MTRVAIALVSVFVGASAAAATGPFESGAPFSPAGEIDTLVLDTLTKQGIQPAHLCPDAVFIRRVYLDVTGTLPWSDDVRTFLADTRPGKRAEAIESLLGREEFADYWSLKWCDALRVKSEFPINLWPNAVQAYHRWIHDAVRRNMPYDDFARELLTSSGSNFRVPQVNFYRAVQARDPASLASAAALTFMGIRTDSWPEDRRSDLATFFSRVAYKKTDEWKEEIVFLDPAQTGPLRVRFPDGTECEVPARHDPRDVFAAWLTLPDNPWFARNAVNRVWAWLFGRGIVNPPDDMGPECPPTRPELLEYLAHELVRSDFDMRHIYRLILNSSTYQQSSIPHGDIEVAEAHFACYPIRRLDAEVLVDAVGGLLAAPVEYSSAIPEPYTYIPATERSIALADGSISSPVLEMFGRPARDTGFFSERNNDPTEEQRRYLLNSSEIQRRIERGPRLRRVLEANKGNPENAVRDIYIAVLSRPPTAEELAVVGRYAQSGGVTRKQTADDLVWALINTKEFLYRH